MLPTCFHDSQFKAEFSRNNTVLPSHLISLTESKWSEKFLLQGDLMSLKNMQVPQALQQATSRDDFPEFISPSRHAPMRVYTKTAGGRTVGSVVNLDDPKSHDAHTMLGPQMCMLCLLIHMRRDQWGSYGDVLISID